MNPITHRLHTPRPDRGSVLLVSLLLSAVIAISLGSFLQLATGASQISYRTYHLGVGMNIAETGLEQAMWAINRTSDGKEGGWDDWADVPYVTLARRRTFALGTIEGGASTEVKVYARERVGSSSPIVIARAIVTPVKGPPVEKWIRVTLSRRSLFAVGALGEEGITASGNNVYFASWNSDPDNDDATLYIPPSMAVLNDNASLATTDLDASINSGNADVNGTAAVGSSDTDNIEVGAQGYIGPFGTEEGVKDPGSITTDFTADLTVPVAPEKTYTVLGAVTDSLTLPRSGDSPDADGNFYYSATELTLTNKTLAITPGANVVLHVDNKLQAVKVGGGSGTIKVGGTITTNTYTGEVTYVPSSLKIYTPGDVDIGGQGSANVVQLIDHTPAFSLLTTTKTTTILTPIAPVFGKGSKKTTIVGWSMRENITRITTVGDEDPTTVTSERTYNDTGILSLPAVSTDTTTITSGSTTPESTLVTGAQPGQPKSFHIYGTRTDEDAKDSAYGPQSFKISGNGNLSGVVYAPNADIEAKGGGNSGYIHGSVVGQSLKFTGNDSFYYDESLAKLNNNARYGIESWTELVDNADRKRYAAEMNF